MTSHQFVDDDDDDRPFENEEELFQFTRDHRPDWTEEQVQSFALEWKAKQFKEVFGLSDEVIELLMYPSYLRLRELRAEHPKKRRVRLNDDDTVVAIPKPSRRKRRRVRLEDAHILPFPSAR
jgi:hypothetical protein